MGKHHDWREDALSISAVWAPSLSCSLFPKSLWGSALIAGFLFVPEFCISCSLLYQQHRFTKTWLILNWAKLNMELSRTLNKPQTHHPRPQEMTFLPKATGFIAFYSKPLWNPRSVIHGRWQLQGVMEPGEKAQSLHGFDSYFAITTLRMDYIKKLGLLLWNTSNARDMRIHPICFLVSAELVIS